MLTREDYDKMIMYMKTILTNTNGDKGKNHPFRSRIKHTMRVLKWTQRLVECENLIVDTDILYTAAIFHDTGYGLDHSNKHGEKSAEIFLKYAKENNLDSNFTIKVEKCIKIHSKKELMCSKDISNEELLLMEADLLDEEGAISIVWDCFSVANETEPDYEKAYEHMTDTLQKRKGINIMKTPKAYEIWNNKMKFLEDFVEELKNDLEY